VELLAHPEHLPAPFFRVHSRPFAVIENLGLLGRFFVDLFVLLFFDLSGTYINYFYLSDRLGSLHGATSATGSIIQNSDW
jgi:hypothetical protein